MMAQPADGHGGGGSEPGAPSRATAPSRGREIDPVPAPLPRDPNVLTDIRAGIERGLAQAQADIGYDLDEVLAGMDRKIAAHRR